MEMFLLSTHNVRFGEKLVSIELYCYFPRGSIFCLLKRGVSSRRFFRAPRASVLMGNNEDIR